jgi:hypothetical protein
MMKLESTRMVASRKVDSSYSGKKVKSIALGSSSSYYASYYYLLLLFLTNNAK